jgi:hypothetical protein
MTLERVRSDLEHHVGAVLRAWHQADGEQRQALAPSVQVLPLRLASLGWKVRLKFTGREWQLSAGREVEGGSVAAYAEERHLEAAIWQLWLRLETRLSDRATAVQAMAA